ncbi:hypothetical protein HK103_007407 [Boothiomyces macroporosus]|uniref:Nucleolar protein 12 n=1 Tax=Boothiomyces macroporosus TaxID=261099 RepID=A0AAD5UL00_9FUNG|nr:hypothetical protein HK103_007407 [Boothiomyces macroporosus]
MNDKKIEKKKRDPKKEIERFKKQALKRPPKEIIEYNEESRHEFVTGFHKRKQQLKKKRVEKQIERSKQEKRDSLREKRRKLYDVLPMVKEIDSINEVSGEKDVVKYGKSVTVTVTPFDPEDMGDLQE